MPIDPESQALLDEAKAAGLPPVYLLPVAQARARLTAAFATRGEPEHVFDVTNHVVPGPTASLGVRAYRPLPDATLPCLVFFHGGGWTVNNLETHDGLCRSLANRTNCVVLSVDYRLAPEHKFPAAIEDSYLAVQWAVNNAHRLAIDPERLAIGGDSSGGTQAAVVAQLARDRGGPGIAFQWMAYPPTDYYLPGTESYRQMASGYSMSRDWMIWFWNHYLESTADVSNPYVSPLRATSFAGLPPALIMTAEFDPLRDEGELYAQRLSGAGIAVTVRRYDGLMHGFLLQRHRIRGAAAAFNDLVESITEALSSRG
jgi:acetyl esterase